MMISEEGMRSQQECRGKVTQQNTTHTHPHTQHLLHDGVIPRLAADEISLQVMVSDSEKHLSVVIIIIVVVVATIFVVVVVLPGEELVARRGRARREERFEVEVVEDRLDAMNSRCTVGNFLSA